MNDLKQILTLAIEMGNHLLRNGGEINRAKETMTRILESYQIEQFDVYVLSNSIWISATRNNGEDCGIVKEVPLGKVHLGRIVGLNQLARDICAHKYSVEDAMEEIRRIESMPIYSKKAIVLCTGVGSAAFCYLFGGGMIDALIALGIGIIEQLFLLQMQKRRVTTILTNILTSMLITFLSILAATRFGVVLADKVIIGSIMLLVPGMAFTTAIRDFYNTDYLSGTIHMIDAILTGFCIAVGVFAAYQICQYATGGVITL